MKNQFKALRELHLVLFPLRVQKHTKHIKKGCTLGDAISYYHIPFSSEFSQKNLDHHLSKPPPQVPLKGGGKEGSCRGGYMAFPNLPASRNLSPGKISAP